MKRTNNVLVQVMKEAMLVGWGTAEVARTVGVCYQTARNIRLDLVHKAVGISLEVEKMLGEVEDKQTRLLSAANVMQAAHERGEVTKVEVENAWANFQRFEGTRELKEKIWRKLLQFAAEKRQKKRGR